MITLHRVRERHVPIEVADLPEAFEGFRILHITDLHLRGIGRRERQVLEIATHSRPDLIAVTGDFIEHRDSLDLCLEFVRHLSAPQGVWGVYGNHEHYSFRSIREFGRALEREGVSILENAWTKVPINGCNIQLAGVDDPQTCHDDMRRTVRGLSPDEACVLLAHSPDIIDQARRAPVDLILSGHTHGGQICLPGGVPMVVPSRYGRRYARGRFHIDGKTLLVSRGVGTSTVPVRVFCPPEVIHVTLHRRKTRKDRVP